MMEQVLYRLHVRLLTVTDRLIGPTISRFIEWGMLIGAILSTVSLLFLHVTYVTNSSQTHWNCILHGLDRAGLYDRSKPANESFLLRHSVDLISLKIISNYNRSVAKGAEDELPHIVQFEYTPLFDTYTHTSQPSYSDYIHWIGATPNLTRPSKSPYGDYLFSFHRGDLVLTQEPNVNHTFSVLQLTLPDDLQCLGPPKLLPLVKRVGYDIVVMNWVIAAFGGQGHFYNTKSKELFNLNYAADFVAKKGVSLQDSTRRVKYEDVNVARQHMKGVFTWGQNSLFTPVLYALTQWAGGVVSVPADLVGSLAQYALHALLSHEALETCRQVLVQRLQQLQNFCAFRLGVIFSTSFLFFISTTLISYILRQTQEKMLRFTYLLQYHIAHNLPYLPLVFTHVIDSLVFVPIIMGIYFFLFEFFSDQLVSLGACACVCFCMFLCAMYLFSAFGVYFGAYLLFIPYLIILCVLYSWRFWCCWWCGWGRFSPSSGEFVC
ncbi:hypothetical protein EON64_00970 [archaeon]|nr:MAG: hypothetical protein EON64_00970 [archaeon]